MKLVILIFLFFANVLVLCNRTNGVNKEKFGEVNYKTKFDDSTHLTKIIFLELLESDFEEAQCIEGLVPPNQRTVFLLFKAQIELSTIKGMNKIVYPTIYSIVKKDKFSDSIEIGKCYFYKSCYHINCYKTFMADSTTIDINLPHLSKSVEYLPIINYPPNFISYEKNETIIRFFVTELFNVPYSE